MPPIAPYRIVRNNLRVLLTTAVWGAEYVDRFLNYSLRTQLSVGNLGACDPRSLFLLITDTQGYRQISSSPIYGALARLLNVEHADIAAIPTNPGDKYSLLTSCQNYALARAADFDAIFFGYGDALWADGSYRAALRRLEEGYDAVFAFGYPVVDKPFRAVIDSMADAAYTQAVALDPRTFAQHVYRHLHPMAHANRWTNEWMTHCPSYVVWDVPEQGLLLRSFHLHPVAIRVRQGFRDFFAPFRLTLDEEFVARLYRTNPCVYVCTNSDELGVCSLAEQTDRAFTMEPRRPVNVGDLAVFAEAKAGLLHRELFSHSIRLVVDNVIETRWESVESEAATLAHEVQRRLSVPDSVLALENPAAFAARVNRQITYQHWRKKSEIPAGIENAVSAYKIVGKSAAGALLPTKESMRQTLHRSALRPVTLVIAILHALRITRALRIFVLPRLPPHQQERVFAAYYRVSAGEPLIANLSARSLSMWQRFMKWLRRLIMVLP